MRLFGELARNRGVPFRVFTDESEALNWLLSEEDLASGLLRMFSSGKSRQELPQSCTRCRYTLHPDLGPDVKSLIYM